MQIKDVQYLSGAVTVDKCPPPVYPEYAFIGRSNVGKSSMINMLTGMKKLARISSTPGKTRIINHFLVDQCWYLVDLPGYGFAKTSKTNRAAWREMIEQYIEHRKNLVSLFLMIDSRLKPQEIDLQFMEMLSFMNRPFIILFTKTDKLNRNQLNASLILYRQTLKDDWELPPEIIATSAQSGLGKDQILQLIQSQNENYVRGK